MRAYDWSKVSREQLERVLDSAHHWEPALHAHAMAPSLLREVDTARAEALVPPLRGRAEVDAEIAEMVREYIRDVGARDAFGSMERGRQKLLALAAEPTAPEIDPLHPTGRCTCGGEGRCDWCKQYPIIDCEFPEPDRCSCEEALGLREKLRVTTGLLTAIELDIHHALAGLK